MPRDLQQSSHRKFFAGRSNFSICLRFWNGIPSNESLQKRALGERYVASVAQRRPARRESERREGELLAQFPPTTADGLCAFGQLMADVLHDSKENLL
jgi:hypothetical protein